MSDFSLDEMETNLTDNSAIATVDAPVSVAEVDDLVQGDLEVSRSKRDGGKLTKAERKDAADAERMVLQARVPWKLIPAGDRYSVEWEQKREIDQWADDWGSYPRIYRSYSREEWTQAITLLADTVTDLAKTHPDYQRTSGVYVEEHADDLLLIRAKKWQLVIQIPAKRSAAGKKFELKAAGQANWGGSDDMATSFAELLSIVPRESRDVLLDICCQYLRDVRIRVNKQVWADQNNDIAYLITGKERPTS